MKKIIPYLKYIVPIACLISVAAVIFMAIKLEDIKDERDAKRSEYNTAAEEFFEDDLPENNSEENEVENNVEDNVIEKNNKNSIDSQPYIVTYDVNEVVKDETENEGEAEENVSDTNTVIKEEEARKILIKIFDEYKYKITFKQVTNDGKYIFEIINKENDNKEVKMVDLEKQTVQTIVDEDE